MSGTGKGKPAGGKRASRIPILRRHTLGQGVVSLSSQDHYCGRWGDSDEPSVACRASYDELIARWLAGGRKPLRRAVVGGLLVRDLAERYEGHCRVYYRKAKKLTAAGRRAIRAMGVLGRLYGSKLLAEFDRQDFVLVRNHWIENPSQSTRGERNARSTVNTMAGHIRAAFRWGAEQGFVPALTLAEVNIPRTLAKGRTDAEEREPVGPPDAAHVQAVASVVRPPARAMIELQCLTGMRPNEVSSLRPRDIDRSGEVWVYRVDPEVNKKEHLGDKRTVLFGPKAQVILGPWLKRAGSPTAWLFTTRTGKRYTPHDYATAVKKTCLRLGLPVFTPNALRHLAGTEIRATHGLEAAQVTLGHRDIRTTQRYSLPDYTKAEDVAKER
jgi:integrase